MPVKKVVKAKKSEPIKKLRTTSGTVVSDKMDKTVVVAVNSLKKHPKYHKRYLSTKKYKVHDPRNKFKKGDAVSFVSCRPISRDKRWRVVYDMKHEA
jgi:small subunit ribosomal protein S17